MDRSIFLDRKIDPQLVGSVKEWVKYHEEENTLFINLFGISLLSKEDVTWFEDSLDEILAPIMFQYGPVYIVVNYDGYNLKSGLEEKYMKAPAKEKAKHYENMRCYSQKAFHAAKLNPLASI